MKVFVVTETSWDTDGNSDVTVAGVFSSKEKIPDRLKKDDSWTNYRTEEVELDKVESW